jgi:hypothetical protein
MHWRIAERVGLQAMQLKAKGLRPLDGGSDWFGDGWSR